MQEILNQRDLKEIERPHVRGGRFSFMPLQSGQDGTPGNFFLQLSRTYNDFHSPRHRHSFDQIRVQLEGDADFDRNGVMTPGMVAYFPEGVYYGPQSIGGESLTLVLQFGGASMSGYLSEAEFQRGSAELRETGTFEAGIFKTAKPGGGTRSQDAYEAVWEHRNGRKLTYPEGRYEAPVFIKPDAAAWRDDADASGVARKHLGTFSEAKTELSMIRLAAGAKVEVPANTLVFVMSGSGRAGSGDWAKRSSLYSGAAADEIVADEESVVLQIELPHL